MPAPEPVVPVGHRRQIMQVSAIKYIQLQKPRDLLQDPVYPTEKLEVLLEPFEGRFDLPTNFVDFSDGTDSIA
jgi:hypothetical protein